MSGARSVTATFDLAQRQLSVTKSGAGTGTVTSSPSGIDCGATCSANFDEGSTVTLTGSPGANTQAAQWTGCDSVNVENKCLVTMSAARSVTATFKLVQRQLSVTKSGAGTGTVTSSPSGIDCGATCSAGFTHGISVTLTGSPGPHTEAAQWSGCTSVTGENKCLVTMSAAKSVSATFNLEPGAVLYTITVAKTGTGAGTVSGSPGSIDCGSTCSSELVEGTKVTLTATPAEGSVFDHWSGGGCSGFGPCEVTLKGARSVKAKFTVTGQRTLTVSKAGTGNGTVTSRPAGTGIDCGASCSSSIAAATKVTLKATPAPGSSFGGWSGACSGGGACRVQMNGVRSLTATFYAAAPPSGGVVVVAASARVKGGKAALKLSCSGGACSGKLKLTAKIRQGAKTKNTVIGRATYNIAAGQSKTIKVKLSAAAKKALKSGHTLKAKLSGPGVVNRTVKLKIALAFDAGRRLHGGAVRLARGVDAAGLAMDLADALEEA